MQRRPWDAAMRHAPAELELRVPERQREPVTANEALRGERARRSHAERALRNAHAELAQALRHATAREVARSLGQAFGQPLAAVAPHAAAGVRLLEHDPQPRGSDEVCAARGS